MPPSAVLFGSRLGWDAAAGYGGRGGGQAVQGRIRAAQIRLLGYNVSDRNAVEGTAHETELR